MAETRTRLTIGSISMPVLEDIWSLAGVGAAMVDELHWVDELH